MLSNHLSSRIQQSNFARNTVRYSEHILGLDKRTGMPAIKNSKDLFVPKFVPIILLYNIPNIGEKGEIVYLHRYQARFLVNRLFAKWGTLWDNVDKYACPEIVRRKRAETYAREKAELSMTTDVVETSHPFDWIRNIRLSITPKIQSSSSDELVKQIDIWAVLHILSKNYEIDLLPENFPNFKPISTYGSHDLGCEIVFKSRTINYIIPLNVVKNAEEEVEVEIDESKLKYTEKLARLRFKSSITDGFLGETFVQNLKRRRGKRE